MIDLALRTWASPRQGEFISAVNEEGGIRSAARKLGVHHSTIVESMAALRRNAVMHGYSPGHSMVREVPEPLLVKRISTNYDAKGDVAQQWVIAEPDKELMLQRLLEAVGRVTKDLPSLASTPGPQVVQEDLCNLYTITDAHLGMLAWHKEGGSDWNLDLAETTLLGALNQMIAGAPRAHTAIINIQGDFLHSDGLTPVTPTSGYVLDQSDRFGKIADAAIRIIRRMITFALKRHKSVHLVISEGNHDIIGSLWLRKMMQALYERENRLTINSSELPYYVYRWGNTMLGFHHGHLKKNENLPLLFAAMYHKIWGETTKRFIHVGHVHHKGLQEHAGVSVVQHTTLAAKDAHAARHGYHSERSATCYTYHKTFGEVGSNTVTPEMLMEAA